MRSSRPLFIWLVVSVLVVAGAQWRVEAFFERRYPPVNELIVTDQYTTDLSSLVLGSHRLAADIAYVQLLQYYGVEEPEEEHQEDEHSNKPHFHDMASGKFPLLQQFGFRILRLDPFFNAAILEVAGALAFNQKRIDESLELLEEAIGRDPDYFRYRLYVGAIVYKNKGQDSKMIALLDEAIKYPDCPVLLQNILGNLHKKAGNFERAAQIYAHIIKTAHSDADRVSAERQLVVLIQQHPDIALKIKSLLDQ
jgi:tetratricopeptide (TPR) repeat protein